MRQPVRRQKGMSLIGLMFVGAILIMISVLIMRVLPAVLNYYTALSDIRATAADPSLRDASMAQVRAAYLRRTLVSGDGDVKSEDLDISKENGEIVISFAYPKKIHLFFNVSLLIDFEGSSSTIFKR